MTHPSSPTLPATRQQLAADVIAIVADHTAVAAADIREQHTLEHDLGLDSLDQVEIVMEIEEEFDIDVPDTIAEQVNTVGDIIAGVAAILGQRVT